MEGIFYIWIGGTYQTPSDYTWDDDPNSPTYGEEFCFSLIRTEWYMEAIIGNEIVRDGNYCEENLADGRPYDYIAFSLEEANSYIPVPKTIVY